MLANIRNLFVMYILTNYYMSETYKYNDRKYDNLQSQLKSITSIYTKGMSDFIGGCQQDLQSSFITSLSLEIDLILLTFNNEYMIPTFYFFCYFVYNFIIEHFITKEMCNIKRYIYIYIDK